MNKAATNHTTKPAANKAAHRQKGVLSGIRVLDFTWKTVGPWASRLLTHYGAEVIHVERAGGWDDHRFAAHRSLTTDAPEPNHVQGGKPLYTDPYFTLQRHFFSPPSLGAYDVRDTLGDCAVAPRPRRRGAPQSYTHAGVTRLQITGGAATPSALALFFPKRPFKCHRKKCANIVSNIWCCQPAYFRTS